MAFSIYMGLTAVKAFWVCWFSIVTSFVAAFVGARFVAPNFVLALEVVLLAVLSIAVLGGLVARRLSEVAKLSPRRVVFSWALAWGMVAVVGCFTATGDFASRLWFTSALGPIFVVLAALVGGTAGCLFVWCSRSAR